MQPGRPPEHTDPAAQNSAEDLDEDRLRVDPLEQGIDPPERWSGADRFGTTAREQSDGADLDQRLAEEQPDPSVAGLDAPAADETEYRPVPDTDSRSDVANYADVAEQRIDALRRGQSADEAGGSVADAIRTPDEFVEIDEEDERR
jgi:hypothetical protein